MPADSVRSTGSPSSRIRRPASSTTPPSARTSRTCSRGTAVRRRRTRRAGPAQAPTGASGGGRRDGAVHQGRRGGAAAVGDPPGGSAGPADPGGLRPHPRASERTDGRRLRGPVPTRRVPGRARHDREGRGRGFLQRVRLHRFRQQRVGARLLHRGLRREADLPERRHRLLHGHARACVLQGPDRPAAGACSRTDRARRSTTWSRVGSISRI